MGQIPLLLRGLSTSGLFLLIFVLTIDTFGLYAPRIDSTGPVVDHSWDSYTDDINVITKLIIDLNLKAENDFSGFDDVFPANLSILHAANREPWMKMLQAAILEKRPAKFAFTGTSVTAGHDNFYNESYPFVFERLFKPIAEAAGLDIIVGNFAMGNNPIQPYDACIPTHIYADADFVSYEQDMMCPGSGYPTCIEGFLQVAYRLHRAPPVMVFAPVTSKSAPPPRTKPYSDFQYDSQIVSNGRILSDVYGEFGIGSLTTRDFEPRAAGLLWNTPDYLLNEKEWGPAANWHPGRYGHMLFGYIVAKEFALLLRSAVAEMSVDGFSFVPRNIKVVPPPHEHVQSVFQNFIPTSIEEPLLRCATLMEPKIQMDMDLVNFVTSDLAFNDTRPDLGTFPNTPGMWQVSLWPGDVPAVTRARSRGAGYADMKWGFKGNIHSGVLEFTVNLARSRPPGLCQPRGEQLPHIQDSSVVQYYFDNDNVTSLFNEQLCVFLDVEFTPGIHRIGVKVIHPVKSIEISHLIFP